MAELIYTPIQAAIVDERGYLTDVWRIYFDALFKQVGGLQALTNTQLSQLNSATVPPVFWGDDGGGDDGGGGAPGQQGPAGSIGPVGPQGLFGFAIDGEDGQDGSPLPGTPGPQGNPGTNGTTGPAGPAGFGTDGEDGADGMPMPGAVGATGLQGLPGVAGANGFGFDGEDGQDGQPIPGPAGAQGLAGAAGVAGAPGFGFDGVDGDDGMPIPGPVGQQGITGAAGPIGPAVYLEAPEADEPMFHLGAIGPQGATGSAGAQGPAGPAVFLEAPEADEPFYFQGPQGNSGPSGLLAFGSTLTANTTINSTVTYTTGGVTLATQTALTGSVWRVRATGTFVAVSSVTARNAQVAAFWGTTQLVAITAPVLISVGQTTNWHLEFILTASSTTAVWTAGFLSNNVASATALVQSQATPASTVVTAGPQTLDLRFSMSVLVATDQWVVQSVTLERLK